MAPYTLMKVVSYCDLSVLSISVMGLKKRLYWIGVRSIKVFLDFLKKKTLQGPLLQHCQQILSVKTTLYLIPGIMRKSIIIYEVYVIHHSKAVVRIKVG